MSTLQPGHARRVVVISDLHLGGAGPRMMSRPDLLGESIDGLPARLEPDEQLELVIAGDFVDFLATAPGEAWTEDPKDAVDKLGQVMAGPDAPVFEALGRLVGEGHRLSVLVGNHDVELALDPVQDALRQKVGAAVHFVDDGRAWRAGGLLVEHGNRYDQANVNDWDGLRALRSAWSRGEPAPVDLDVSAGSRIVERVVNPIKDRYPFLDLLQPQGPMLAYLVLAFEPSLAFDLDNVRRLLFAGARRLRNPRGGVPPRSRNVAADGPGVDSQVDDRLRRAFGEHHDRLSDPSSPVGAADWLMLFAHGRNDSLDRIIASGQPIPRRRLEQVQAALLGMSIGDRSLQPDGPTGSCGAAADRILAGSTAERPVDTVVMGHTHQPRHEGPPDRATYVNTGTWIDLVTLPDEALIADDQGLAV